MMPALTAMTEAVGVSVNLQMAASNVADAPAAAEFQRWVQLALADHAGVPADACVTVRLVDEDEIAELNERYRQVARPTNVLAFPAAAVLPEVEEEAELGDLIICMDVVRREAAEQGKPMENHLAHLTMHGSLHLVGYDHMDDAEASAMEALETRLLAELGIPDPYEYRGGA